MLEEKVDKILDHIIDYSNKIELLHDEIRSIRDFFGDFVKKDECNLYHEKLRNETKASISDRLDEYFNKKRNMLTWYVGILIAFFTIFKFFDESILKYHFFSSNKSNTSSISTKK